MEAFFSQHRNVAVAFSGGVDSAYLLLAAKAYHAHVKAYYVNTPFQTHREYLQALSLAQTLDVPFEKLDLDTLALEEIRSNPENRCYYCKKLLFTTIMAAARKDGFELILEGTNASDDVAQRPGYQALQELGVRSPLRELGLTKAEIRRRAQKAGLPVWNQPSNACLATRIPTGKAITPPDLSRTEAAEALLSSLGFSNHRVRLWNDCARIQIPEHQLSLLLTHRETILARLKPLYQEVFLDLEVRND